MATEFSFEADDKPIEDVLFSQRKYRVPRYQRPYAWGLDQVTEFWNDLISSSEPYFLGSLVFCTETEKRTGYVEIIDGQQRLLTITIFIAVLRDLAQTLDKSVADRYHRQDIAVEDRSGLESFRILPDDSVKDFFGSYIQKRSNGILAAKPRTPEEVRVRDNYQFLYDKVSNEIARYESSEDRLKALNDLRQRVADLVVIDVELAREEDAYEIFETTNARGIDLSVSDLLKNLIFQKIPAADNRDLAKDIWQEITNNIQATGTELKKFIRYYWLSKYPFVTEKKLYREIKKRITDWKALLDELRESSEWYNVLLEPSEEAYQELKNGDKIYDSILALSLMDVSQCYVLLMSILRNATKLGTDPTRVIQLIEKFTFQYSVVCKLPGNKVERMYSRYAQQIEQAVAGVPAKRLPGKIQQIFASLEKELKAECPPYELFNENFADISYKNSDQSRRLIKYILNQIDKHYRPTAEYRIDFSNVNIEHVLPQNPDPAWKLTKAQIAGYVNKLGNLTLVAKKINAKVQNKPIPQKLHELRLSALPITKQLVDELEKLEGKWGESEIAARQDRMAELAYKEVWNF